MRWLLPVLAVTGFAAFGSGVAAEPDIICQCRAHGLLFNLGQTTCLMTPGGPRQATCIMTQNITSWDVSNAPCASSRLKRDTAAG
jgi:hypothetical protein